MRTKALLFVSVVSGALATGTAAFAQTTFNPQTEVTSWFENAISTLGPMIIAVAGASVGLLVLSVGLRAAYRAVRGVGKSSPV